MAGVLGFINAHQHLNCFYGVATRDGTGGATKNLLQLPAVWVDIDFKDTPREEAWRRAQRFAYTPSAWMVSGGGVHSIYFLDEPIAVSEDGK